MYILPSFVLYILHFPKVFLSSSLLHESSLLVTVLDSFHFDHQTLSREMEAAKAREGELRIRSVLCAFIFLLLYKTC